MERPIIIFSSKELLEDALLLDIKLKLTEAISKFGIAKLLLSGGSTPSGLYQKLSSTNLEWSKVIVGLVDERYIENTSNHSNEKLIRSTLLINQAKKATFVPMIKTLSDEKENFIKINQSYSIFNESTVVVLGMGDDGHTASLFPKDPDSISATNSKSSIHYTNSPSIPMRRITCTPSLLFSAKNIFLMITGENKKAVLFNAVNNKLPIALFKDVITTIYFSK